MPVGSTSSSRCVSQTAAGQNKAKAVAAKLTEQNQTSTTVGVIIAAIIGGFLWWRQRRNGDPGKRSGDVPTSKVKAEGRSDLSNLPRNRSANNKKNKARRKSERDRRDSKRKNEITDGNDSSAKRQFSEQPRDPNNDKLILNYHHWTDTN